MNETPNTVNKYEDQDVVEVLRYLEEKYHDLENNYSADGVHAESCSLLAMDIAKLFINKGYKPQIFSVRGEVIDLSGNTETLYPKRYSNQVSWGGHTVCVFNEVVYDPMLGVPVSIDEYRRNAFSKDVNLYVEIDSDKIVEFVAR